MMCFFTDYNVEYGMIIAGSPFALRVLGIIVLFRPSPWDGLNVPHERSVSSSFEPARHAVNLAKVARALADARPNCHHRHIAVSSMSDEQFDGTTNKSTYITIRDVPPQL